LDSAQRPWEGAIAVYPFPTLGETNIRHVIFLPDSLSTDSTPVQLSSRCYDDVAGDFNICGTGRHLEAVGVVLAYP
jgi:hypothetical protein